MADFDRIGHAVLASPDQSLLQVRRPSNWCPCSLRSSLTAPIDNQHTIAGQLDCSHSHDRVVSRQKDPIVDVASSFIHMSRKQGCRIHPHRTAFPPKLQQTHPYPLPHISISNLAYRNCLPSFPYISVNIFTAIASSLPPTASPRSAIQESTSLFVARVYWKISTCQQHSQRAFNSRQQQP
jgi:hypothetical protein